VLEAGIEFMDVRFETSAVTKHSTSHRGIIMAGLDGGQPGIGERHGDASRGLHKFVGDDVRSL